VSDKNYNIYMKIIIRGTIYSNHTFVLNDFKLGR